MQNEHWAMCRLVCTADGMCSVHHNLIEMKTNLSHKLHFKSIEPLRIFIYFIYYSSY